MKKHLLVGTLLTLTYFLVHLFIMNDYALSWDFHYHQYAGLYHLGLPVPKVSDPPSVPFSPPDPRTTIEDPFGPFTQILPTLSYVFLHERLSLLSGQNAYNVPMILFGSLGVFVLFLFLLESLGRPYAFAGMLFLAFLPAHWGYLHNNMKDVPSAFAFTLSLYTFWRLVKYKRAKDLIFAVLSFAFAFNVKINSVMIPVVCGVWYVLTSVKISNSQFAIRNSFFILSYFLLAPIAALALWWPFWNDPMGKLLELPQFYSHNTLNIPVLYMGQLLRSGVNIPVSYPFIYLAITTPLPILVSFLIGLYICTRKTLKKDSVSLILLLWFFLPLSRYVLPNTSAIDGVRHFMEVVYPLCAIAAVGAVKILSLSHFVIESLIRNLKLEIRNLAFWKFSTLFIRIAVLLVVYSLVRNIVRYHPYQTSYFNELIGGIRGAEGKFDIDFWGTPQKEAVVWLNDHAPENATVHIVMGQSTAAYYLREDLQRLANSKDAQQSDYTVVLNRRSFFPIYSVDAYMKERQKNQVFTKEIDGVSLVWVFKNEKVI